MINISIKLNFAGIHLPCTLHVDLLTLQEIINLPVLLLLYTGEGVDGVSSSVNLDIEGSVRTSGSCEVYMLHVLVFDEDRRFVHKYKSSF